jgi:hypothetical protein
MYRTSFAFIQSKAHLTPCSGFFCCLSLPSRVAFIPGLRFKSVPNHASSSIPGRPASGFLQVSLSKVPRHLVCRVSPTVLAEALPINANDKGGSIHRSEFCPEGTRSARKHDERSARLV